MVKTLAAIAVEPAELRMRFQGLLERAASVAAVETEPIPGPYLTISREAESGGSEIARRVGEQLGWTVLDRVLVHDLAIDSARFGLGGSVDLILRALELRGLSE